jgi:shikimate dehydrogenase
MESIRLGLIGDNIAGSKSPLLHRLAGELCGLHVTYERLIPAYLGQDFDAVFERCRCERYRGINITYPYKEHVVAKLDIDDAIVRAVAACNTVVFDGPRPLGLNTDYTGFIDAFRGTFGTANPGTVAMAGSGGVGKAIGFALGSLGASALRLFDRERPKAEALASSLAAVSGMAVEIAGSIQEAVTGADGIVNCTPLGMLGHDGSAIPKSIIGGQRWVFDAVYTPVDTRFLKDAGAAGIAAMSGYELFFFQGVNAFKIFTGRDVDQAALRRELLKRDRDVWKIP